MPFETDFSSGRMRNSIKGIIIRDGRILLTVNRDKQGIFHLLPGGGQNLGERMTDALVREVREETGWTVKPGRLLFIRDYIAAHHEFADTEGDVHQIELMFLAEPLSFSASDATAPDAWQTGVEWVEISDLRSIRIYPSVLGRLIREAAAGTYDGTIYLGDVN